MYMDDRLHKSLKRPPLPKSPTRFNNMMHKNGNILHSIDVFYMTQFQNHHHQFLVREVRIDQHPIKSTLVRDPPSTRLLILPWHCHHYHHRPGHCRCHCHLRRHWSHRHESLRPHLIEIRTFALVVRLLDSCHGCIDDRFPQDVWLPIDHLVRGDKKKKKERIIPNKESRLQAHNGIHRP